MSRVNPLLALAFAFLPGPLLAQEESATMPVSLSEVVARAMQNQPSVQAAAARQDAAQIQIDRARVARRPTVDFNLSSGAQPNRVGIGDTAFFRLGYSSNLSASMLLYDFGQSASQISATRASANAAAEDELDARASVAFNAAQAYYALWTAQEVLLRSQAALTEAEARVKTAQALVDAGARPKIEVSRAAVDRASAASEVRRAQGELRKAQVALSIAIAEPGARVTYSASEPPDLGAPPPLARAYEEARAARPDIAAQEARLTALRAQIEVARSVRRPVLAARSTLSMQGPVVFQDETLPAVASFSALVSLSVPLYDGGSATASESSARADLRAAEAQLRSAELALRSELEDAYASYDAAQASYAASQETTKLAAENQTIAQSRYEAGAGSAIEISDAAVSLAQAQRAELQDLALLYQARLQIEFALGHASTLAPKS